MSGKLNFQSISDTFLLYASAAVLFLHLFLPVLLKEHYTYASEPLASFAVIILIWIMGIVFVCKKDFFPSGYELPLVLFLTAGCVSMVHSAYPEGSMLFMVTMASQVMYFYILIDVLKTKSARSTFSLMVMALLAAIAFFGIFEYFLPSSSYLHGTDKFIAIKLAYKRVGSLFGAPNVLAGFYVLAIPMLSAWYVLATEGWQKIVSVVLLMASLVTFAMTLSFLCTVNLAIVTLILTPWILKEWFNKKLPAMFYGAAAILAVTFFAFIALKRHDLSIGTRTEYFKAAWMILKDNWLLGSGADTFRYLSPQYTQTMTYSGYVHNSYLQVFLETGIIGLIAAILFVGVFIRQTKQAFLVSHERSTKVVMIALVWGLSTFYVDNLTNLTLLSFDVSLFGWVALAAWCAFTKKQGMPVINPAKKTVMVVASIFIIMCLLIESIMTFSGFLNYQKAMSAIDNKEYTASFGFLEQAKKLSPGNQYVYAGEGLLFLKVYGLNRDHQFLNKAEEKFQEAVSRCPFYYMNYVMLSKIANEQKDEAKLQAYLKKLAQLCPTRYPKLQEEIRQSRTLKKGA